MIPERNALSDMMNNCNLTLLYCIKHVSVLAINIVKSIRGNLQCVSVKDSASSNVFVWGRVTKV